VDTVANCRRAARGSTPWGRCRTGRTPSLTVLPPVYSPSVAQPSHRCDRGGWVLVSAFSAIFEVRFANRTYKIANV